MVIQKVEKNSVESGKWIKRNSPEAKVALDIQVNKI